MNSTVIIAAAIAALIIAKAARQAGALDSFGDPEDQTGSMLDYVPDALDIAYYAQDAWGEIDMEQAQRNLNAVLYSIRKSEGTAAEGGYYALFGWPSPGRTFSDTTQHPRRFFTYTDKAGKTIRTSAAGAYQITATTYDSLMSKYPGRFGGFAPHDQDAMAIALIEERGAMRDIAAGRFDRAIGKIRPIWASLPGAGVNQPERSMDYIKQAYLSAGGALA